MLELQGKGWLCLALLLSAVTSSHDATELCRGKKQSRQHEASCLCSRRQGLMLNNTVLPKGAPPPRLSACPACAKLGPVVRSSAAACGYQCL